MMHYTLISNKVLHLKQCRFDVNICSTMDAELHAYVYSMYVKRKLAWYHAITVNVNMRLMQKDIILFLHHCRPTQMSIPL